MYSGQKEGMKDATIHSKINAIKFYFEKVLGREKMFIEIPRPKKHLILPQVLSQRELGRLLNALDNKKYKAILFTTYSAGLRVSEVVHVQIILLLAIWSCEEVFI
jgi:integrase/recombinase XerD